MVERKMRNAEILSFALSMSRIRKYFAGELSLLATQAQTMEHKRERTRIENIVHACNKEY